MIAQGEVDPASLAGRHRRELDNLAGLLDAGGGAVREGWGSWFGTGRMGVLGKEALPKGAMGLARSVAGADGTTVVGGGESVEAVKASGYASRISHISTGGGASLEFISGETLP